MRISRIGIFVLAATTVIALGACTTRVPAPAAHSPSIDARIGAGSFQLPDGTTQGDVGLSRESGELVLHIDNFTSPAADVELVGSDHGLTADDTCFEQGTTIATAGQLSAEHDTLNGEYHPTKGDFAEDGDDLVAVVLVQPGDEGPCFAKVVAFANINP